MEIAVAVKRKAITITERSKGCSGREIHVDNGRENAK